MTDPTLKTTTHITTQATTDAAARAWTLRPLLSVLAAWIAVLIAVPFIRYRGEWPFYVGLHRRAAGLGAPDFVRHLDYPLIVLLVVVFAALVARVLTKTRVTDALALRAPGWSWLVACFVSLLPMVAGGVALMLNRGHALQVPEVLKGVARAPLAEELLFRGVLVALPMAVMAQSAAQRSRFWVLAVCSALLFALWHVAWTGPGIASGWPVLLVTCAGGVWFAWLLRVSGSLWVPVLMHAGMNLGWALAGGESAAGGGWIAHALRAMTIALLTAWAIRYGRRQSRA